MISLTITPLTLTKRRFITALKMLGINPMVKFIIPNKFELAARLFDYIALSNYTMPAYNVALSSTIDQLVKQRGTCTFIDIGASIGDTVLIAETALRNDNQSAIYFVEGDPEFYAMAVENTRNAPHVVKGFNTFLAEKDGELTSVAIEKTSANLTLSTDDASNGTTVSFRSLESLTKQHSITPNFIKVDIEGFEYKVLRGARKLLSEHHPCVLFELNIFDENAPELQEIFSFFREVGYRNAYFFTNHGWLVAKLLVTEIEAMRELISRLDGKTIHFYDVLIFDQSLQFSFSQLEHPEQR